MTRGKFITFEGGDGAGKTTLINKVAALLTEKHYKVLATREPGGTSLGEDIRKILLRNSEQAISSKAELFLFLASRVQHIEEKIEPALEKGKIVLCDRFNDSSIIYQGVGRSLGVDYVESLCNYGCGGLTPDLTIYIDIPPETALARIGPTSIKDRIEKEGIDFYKALRKGYQSLAQAHPLRIHTIDGSQTIDSVYNQARVIIETLLETTLTT